MIDPIFRHVCLYVCGLPLASCAFLCGRVPVRVPAVVPVSTALQRRPCSADRVTSPSRASRGCCHRQLAPACLSCPSPPTVARHCRLVLREMSAKKACTCTSFGPTASLYALQCAQGRHICALKHGLSPTLSQTRVPYLSVNRSICLRLRV